jgi:hypothetical protein
MQNAQMHHFAVIWRYGLGARRGSIGGTFRTDLIDGNGESPRTSATKKTA